MTSTKPAKPSTRDRVLSQAMKVARAEGIEAVTHKGIATALDLSSSNVLYYFKTAAHLRRAVAQNLLRPMTDRDLEHVQGWVQCRLQEDHGMHVAVDHRITGYTKTIPQRAELVALEALTWLARNGVRNGVRDVEE